MEQGKQSWKRIEQVFKRSEVNVEISLSRLEQHQKNITAFLKEGDRSSVIEQLKITRQVIAELNRSLNDCTNLHKYLDELDCKQLDTRLASIRTVVLEKVSPLNDLEPELLPYLGPDLKSLLNPEPSEMLESVDFSTEEVKTPTTSQGVTEGLFKDFKEFGKSFGFGHQADRKTAEESHEENDQKATIEKPTLDDKVTDRHSQTKKFSSRAAAITIAGGLVGALVGGPVGIAVGVKVGGILGLSAGGAAGAFLGTAAGQDSSCQDKVSNESTDTKLDKTPSPVDLPEMLVHLPEGCYPEPSENVIRYRELSTEEDVDAVEMFDPLGSASSCKQPPPDQPEQMGIFNYSKMLIGQFMHTTIAEPVEPLSSPLPPDLLTDEPARPPARVRQPSADEPLIVL